MIRQPLKTVSESDDSSDSQYDESTSITGINQADFKPVGRRKKIPHRKGREMNFFAQPSDLLDTITPYGSHQLRRAMTEYFKYSTDLDVWDSLSPTKRNFHIYTLKPGLHPTIPYASALQEPLTIPNAYVQSSSSHARLFYFKYHAEATVDVPLETPIQAPQESNLPGTSGLRTPELYDDLTSALASLDLNSDSLQNYEASQIPSPIHIRFPHPANYPQLGNSLSDQSSSSNDDSWQYISSETDSSGGSISPGR